MNDAASTLGLAQSENQPETVVQLLELTARERAFALIEK